MVHVIDVYTNHMWFGKLKVVASLTWQYAESEFIYGRVGVPIFITQSDELEYLAQSEESRFDQINYGKNINARVDHSLARVHHRKSIALPAHITGLAVFFCEIFSIPGTGAALRTRQGGVYPVRGPTTSGEETSFNPIITLNDQRQRKIIL